MRLKRKKMQIAIDINSIQPGDIFITEDPKILQNKAMVQAIIQKGAKKIIKADIFKLAQTYRSRLKNCSVLAIIGSAGKSTIINLLYSILKEKFFVLKTDSTMGIKSLPFTLLKADSKTEIILLEFSSKNANELKKLIQIARPTHLIFGDLDNDLKKASNTFFRKPLQWEKKKKTVCLTPHSSTYTKLLNKTQKYNYQPLIYEGSDLPSQNLNLCYLLGKYFELTENEIQKNLQKYQPDPHQFEIIKTPKLTIIDDTTNNHYQALIFAIQYLKKFFYRKSRKILVLGPIDKLSNLSKKEQRQLEELILDSEIAMIFSQTKNNLKLKLTPVYPFSSLPNIKKRLLQEIKKEDIILIKSSAQKNLTSLINILKTQT